MRRCLSMLLATAALAVALAAPAAAQGNAPAKATLRLKWLGQTSFAGPYVAVAKGYYREQGLDLTVVPGGPNLLAENLVASGTDTFGLGGGSESLLAARDKGLPVVGLAVIHQRTPITFVVHEDSPVRQLEDLRGRTASAWFTGSQHMLTSMLARRGIRKDEVKIVPQQVSMTPFVSREVDMAAVTYYNELLTLYAQNVGKLRFFAPDDYGITLPRDIVFTTEKMVAEQPKLVQGFVTATLKGWKAALDNPKEAVDIVMAAIPGLARPHQEAMLAECAKLMLAGRAKDEGLGIMDEAAFEFVNRFLVENEVLKAPVDLAKAVDRRFWAAAPLADKKL